jgi:hypothetical protein
MDDPHASPDQDHLRRRPQMTQSRVADMNGIPMYEDGADYMGQPSHDKIVELAEHELAKALHNYYVVVFKGGHDIAGYYALDVAQQKFYERFAIPRAIYAIWQREV